MPSYSGIHYRVILRAPNEEALVQLQPVSARDWEASAYGLLDRFPDHEIFGRIRNFDVDLLGDYPNLRTELESLDYTVRIYNPAHRMSIYHGVRFKDRTVVQKLQDRLWQALNDDKGEIPHAWIAATKGAELLVLKLDRHVFNPGNPSPKTLTWYGTVFSGVGYVLDNEVIIGAPEQDVARFLLPSEPYVIYRYMDRTTEASQEYYKAIGKEKRVKEHKKEKKRKQKAAKHENAVVETSKQTAGEGARKIAVVDGFAVDDHVKPEKETKSDVTAAATTSKRVVDQQDKNHETSNQDAAEDLETATNKENKKDAEEKQSHSTVAEDGIEGEEKKPYNTVAATPQMAEDDDHEGGQEYTLVTSKRKPRATRGRHMTGRRYDQQRYGGALNQSI